MSKVKFKTPYTNYDRTISKAGNRMRDEYEYDIDRKSGTKILVKKGETDIYEEIQQYAEDVKIENILKRVALGDMSDFRPDGIYADVTDIPTNLIEAQAHMVKVENIWNNVPIEIKDKYNHNLDEFIAAAGSEAWLIDMGYMNPKAEPTPTLAEQTKVEVPSEE